MASVEIQKTDEDIQVYEFPYDETIVDSESVDAFPCNYECADFHHLALQSDNVETVDEAELEYEYTLCIIKPGAYSQSNKIIKRIKQEGFSIIARRDITWSPEQASEFYIQHYGTTWFPNLVLKMSSGKLVVLILAKKNAIQEFRTLMGHPRVSIARKEAPFCLRALYGLKGDMTTNAVHGSANQEEAQKEISFFFRNAMAEPFKDIKENLFYLKSKLFPTLREGLFNVCKERPPDPIRWLAEWLILNNPRKPKYSIDLASLPCVQYHIFK